MNQTNIILKLEEFPFFNYLFRLILFTWIGFAIYQFNINPVFFSLSIIVAIFMSIRITRCSMVLTDQYFEYVEMRGLAFFDSKTLLYYKQIKKITYIETKMSTLSLILNLIHYVPKKDDEYEIELKDGTYIYFTAVGDRIENQKAVEIIKNKI